MTKPNRARLSTERDEAVSKVLRCPTCSRANPADAYYCHFDGKALFKELQQVPLHVGTLLFPTPFCFSNGNACANFNQLALACANLWDESGELLKEGIWATFFAAMGRMDLASAARLAAKEEDRDRAVSQFLERLPADPEFLRPAEVAVGVPEINLERLAPGTDYVFDLYVLNKGMLLLHGSASSNFDWLVFGGQVGPLPDKVDTPRIRACQRSGAVSDHGPSQKLFQTRQGCTIPVLILGSKLRAGLKPMTAEIIVDTNGGTITVPIRADIPIRPFPKGAGANDLLAGVRSPRELAVKAREKPKEAGIVFEQGAVKAWYASNGWTYPIKGSDGQGAGAVQQFFEVLGLTKPPRLEIDTSFLMFKGRVGESLNTRVTVRTRDGKPVYAQAWSSQGWVKPGPIKYLGAKVQIPVEIVIPPDMPDTAQAQVLIQGNGDQRFIVPVTVTVRR